MGSLFLTPLEFVQVESHPKYVDSSGKGSSCIHTKVLTQFFWGELVALYTGSSSSSIFLVIAVTWIVHGSEQSVGGVQSKWTLAQLFEQCDGRKNMIIVIIIPFFASLLLATHHNNLIVLWPFSFNSTRRYSIWRFSTKTSCFLLSFLSFCKKWAHTNVDQASPFSWFIFEFYTPNSLFFCLFFVLQLYFLFGFFTVWTYRWGNICCVFYLRFQLAYSSSLARRL